MGRSVCVPSEATATVYLHHPSEESNTKDSACEDWGDFLEDLQGVLQSRYPSLRVRDHWADREEHIILANTHANIIVCEYCGIVSVSVVPYHGPYSEPTALALSWCQQIGHRSFYQTLLKAYPDRCLHRLGSFSNGESVYKHPTNQGSLGMGLVVERGECI